MIQANVSTALPIDRFAQDVRAGLCHSGQKTLPPKYFYDDLGSALFDAITCLPEYGITRAERRLLENHAVEIAQRAPAPLVIELGSGSAAKTRCVLEALLHRTRVDYCSVEISRAALDQSHRALKDLPGLRVHGIAADYLDGLEEALQRRPPQASVLVLFLGSSLGNFEHASARQFLRNVRSALRSHDSLLLGNDLLKPEASLLCAYDDALGVTAAFNLNVLLRMNRELGADFVLPNFRHCVRFVHERGDVEMHIESTCDQIVRFREIGFSVPLRKGETIHTESSHKYSLAEIDALAQTSGFERRAQWCDEEWPFASTLLVAV
ncbi:MAG: L-histidine N(alpha)-methyltransferase [Dokdonella sp.]